MRILIMEIVRVYGCRNCIESTHRQVSRGRIVRRLLLRYREQQLLVEQCRS